MLFSWTFLMVGFLRLWPPETVFPIRIVFKATVQAELGFISFLQQRAFMSRKVIVKFKSMSLG